MKYCPNCGTEAKEMRYCSSCGTNLQTGNSPGYQPQPKNKWVALLLFLFLGVFGAHRFYIGKIGTGILMFLMGLFVIYVWNAVLAVEMAGRGLSETSNTIVIIGGVLAIILLIWGLTDLIRILTGSFTRSSINSDNGKSMRSYTFFFLVLVALILAFGIYNIYSKNRLLAEAAKSEAEAKAAAAMEAYRAQITADSLAREDSKKKKKASDFNITPKQIEHTLKIQKSTKPLEKYEMQKEK